MTKFKVGEDVNTRHGKGKIVSAVIVHQETFYRISNYNSGLASVLTESQLTKIEEHTMVKTKEDLLQIIAEAEKAIEAIEAKWTPPVGNWVIYATGEIDNVSDKEFGTIVQECGLLRATEAIALRASKEVSKFCKLLAYRDQYSTYKVNIQTEEIVFDTRDKYCVRQTKDGYELELHEWHRLGTVYFDKPTAIKLVNDLNSGKYIL